jgi:hypothetical protein
MKNSYRPVILAALGLASVAAVHAESYGDLIVGFTTGSGNDVITDLGSLINNPVTGSTALYNGETWSASTLGISSSTSYQWGVIGDESSSAQGTSFDTLWTTYAGGVPDQLNGSTAWGSPNTGITTIAAQLPGGLSGFVQGGQASIPVDVQLTPSVIPNPSSWNTETISGSLNSDFANAYLNPNASGASGVNLYQINDDNSAPTIDGSFSLDNNGTLTFSTAPVPEPTTYGLLAGAGLLFLSFQLRRKHA